MRWYALDSVIIRSNDQVHLSSEVADSLESVNVCVISCFGVSVARSCPTYRDGRNIRDIDRSAFVADPVTELVGVCRYPLCRPLQCHPTKSRVIEIMSFP